MTNLRTAIVLACLIGLGAPLGLAAEAAGSKGPSAAKAKASEAPPPSAEELKRRKDWNDSMILKAAPKKGCFVASYPSTDWKEVPCVKAPNIPAPPRHGPRPAVVGNNNDISASAPSGHITQAIGHFENVTNVTSESGPIANAGADVSDAYTLQINSDFFTNATACAGSPNAGCQAWEQWIFWNRAPGAGSVSMQYWLIAYNANCPMGQSWNQIALYGGTYCWKNSANSTSVPNQPITSMANWTFTGSATSTGDSVSLSTGTNVYTASGDNAVSASTGWGIAEFNIFGYGGNNLGGGTAKFNSGASTDVRTQIVYGGRTAPGCAAQGFTAEMNNLSFGPTAPTAAGAGPAVIFEQSIAGGATSNCAAASTIGDTHLRTFGGLFYDFQAAGDFTLAEVQPGFEVQTRQVSGAPMWPEATVNKAVAARIGKTQVAICLAASAEGAGATIHVNGAPTIVNDGQTLELAGGVGLSRMGNVLQLTSDEGNSVRATLNAGWIDVDVGLGRWPSAVRGLIANANGDVNQIETRDHVVLSNPFAFADLYGRFTDSWRVDPKSSMLAVCGGGASVEVRTPHRPFYAVDLETSVRDKARAVCAAAGVKEGALFEACVLDVAVTGKEEAAKVYVGLKPPKAVGTVRFEGTGGGFRPRYWILLLIAIALIAVWLVRKK